MEAGGSGARQSGATSAGNPGPYDSQRLPPREPLDRYYREAPGMATATLISPSNPYHGHHTPFSSGHHSAGSGPSIAGMISPVEPRRHSDDNETSHRQSLPSLSEVISGAKPSPFPPSQPPSAVPGSMHSFPSTYSSGPPRSFPEQPSSDKHSPRSLHPTGFGPRPEPLPSFTESARPPPFTTRHGPPPINSFPGPQPSPPIKPDHSREVEAKSLEQNGPYHHPAHQHPPPVYHHPHAGPLPPGQIPLPSYPVSPRHSAALPPPFESHRPPVHADEGDYAPARPQYDRAFNRAMESWSYTDCLERISGTSRTIFDFGESWRRVAAEQHGSQPIPDRLPTEQEVADMVSNVEYLRSSLDALRHVVRQANERARAAGKAKGYEEEDSTMYEGLKPNGSYGIGEVKKRRGRAAPPGRCHSCNRIDTPEWRRGPDGARTLCNACGLHYAKLERKRQLEARSIRPKSPHGN